MTADFAFAPPPQPSAAILDSTQRFPLRRIFCVGRNYAAHAAEMGHAVDREAPFYFTKSAHALCPAGASIDYPPGTQDCHYEMEFVVAIGGSVFECEEARAMQAVYGYACGIDLTRRDLQALAKEKRRPWDLGKDFENAAVLGTITPVAQFGDIADQQITLHLDGAPVQQARLSDMVWSVPEVIAHLSRFYHLEPGDLIYTGTPAGVGPFGPGSRLEGAVQGLEPISLDIRKG